MKIILFGSVVLTFLTAAKDLFAESLPFLPLGGTSTSEMGIVFGLAFAVATLRDLFAKR